MVMRRGRSTRKECLMIKKLDMSLVAYLIYVLILIAVGIVALA